MFITVYEAVIPPWIQYMKSFVFVLIASMTAAGLAFVCGQNMSPVVAAQIGNQDLTSPLRVIPENRAEVQLSYAPVVRDTAPAVVNVYTSRMVRRSNDFFDFMFGMQRAPREGMQSSLGSGVIVRDSGVIVTNAHVVEGADELRVVLNDRREFKAEIIAEDEKIDLAVLKIDADGERLPRLHIQEDADIEIGDIVLAIGNPFGVGQTVTSGIISALSRTNVTDISSFIQTDAAINPGNSGGALVNLDGELIGINTAIFSRSGGSNGIGFAIPAELVARAVDSAMTEGRIARPWLGARTNAVDSALAATVGLDRARGAMIAEIYPDGPADVAGLRERDVILALGDTDINDESGLRFKLATFRLGEDAELKVWRDGRERTLSVRVELPREEPPRDERLLNGYHPLAGATIVNLSPALSEEIGTDMYLQGVMITQLHRQSVARYNGLRTGDIIVRVNKRKISSSRQLERVLNSSPDGGDWDLRIDRRGRLFDVPVRYLPRRN